ncbi:precorrin-6A/cobalt-precorrin-6A reductase [Marivita sp. S2033]|uniref:precorrin-6A/cobalt-precorrin-6A reductase n=1 Tax=Marivita sp. S2033 TaxID=3373187 RepID=UPI0039826A0D
MRDLETGQVAIIGGSAEARALAQRLGSRARVWRPARDRVTGQVASTETELQNWIHGASALVIAPHPCDAETLSKGAVLARSINLPSVTIRRPEWRAGRRDLWIPARNVDSAAARVPHGARVLVTLGRAALTEMRALRQAHVFVRQLSERHTTFPLRHGRYLTGTAPFTIASEIALMRRFRIDTVLTRNAGGPGGWPKVAAARALALPVVMVARPRVDLGPVVCDVDEAITWLEARTWWDA